jgi:diguanylate cyclase (GGDEF)-like protein
MRRLHVALAAVLLLVWTTFLGSMFQREAALEDDRIRGIAVGQARALSQQLADMRAWNDAHGGVYVPVTPTTPPNPWIQSPERDVTTTSGRALTMLNHAYMTRQVAEITRARRGIRLHLTSRSPLRPGNGPDAWERAALEGFERGDAEHVDFIADAGGHETFRYIAPLLVEESCLPCHAQQGDRVGQVRGGLSVTFPADALVASRTAFRRSLGLASLVLWCLGAGLIASVTVAYHQKSGLAARLRELTLVDELTGLHNRRGFLVLATKQLQIARRTGRPDLLLFVDLDGMKTVNDVHGHAAGDAALLRTAGALRAAFRSSDILARFGGDEFVVLCADTGPDALETLLAGLRRQVDDANAGAATPWHIALSVGAAAFDPAREGSLDDLLREADAAMYRAKQQKRGRPAAG